MDRKKYIVEASDDVKKVMAMGVTHGSAIWTDTTDIENLEELNSDYINEHFGDLQDTAYKRGVNDGSIDVKERVDCAYQRGLDDAWETAKKIALMDTETSENVTGYFGLFRIMENLTPMQAIEKLKAYEEQKADDEIKVGDEVIYIEHKFIVFATETEEHYASLFDVNGRHASASQSECKKTGRHFDIASILEDMRE